MKKTSKEQLREKFNSEFFNVLKQSGVMFSFQQLERIRAAIEKLSSVLEQTVAKIAIEKLDRLQGVLTSTFTQIEKDVKDLKNEISDIRANIRKDQ